MAEIENLRIRQATEDDTERVAPLAIETWVDAFADSMPDEEVQNHVKTYLSRERIRAYIIEDIVLVAEIDDVMVGYTHISDLSHEVDTATDESKSLRRLYVHADYQKRGIGSALIEAALEQALFKNARYIYLDVWEKNPGAIALYQRYGFKRVGELRFIHESGKEGDLDFIMRRDNEMSV